MPDLSLYKVNLNTEQPDGRKGESPRSAFTKFNDLIDELESGAASQIISPTEPEKKYANLEWIDTSTTPPTIKRRNTQNTGWITIGSYSQAIGTAAGANLPNGVSSLGSACGLNSASSSTANAVPQADASGKLNPNWLSTNSFSDAALVAMSGGKLVVITDNYGNSQLCRRIPIHTFETLAIQDCPFTGPLDCFIRQDGSLRPYVDVPVYQASAASGRAVSQADKDPWALINADTARARCEELNSNSLMISQEIWAMLCWNMIAQGFQPRGNTAYGRSHSNTYEFGRRGDGRVPDDRNGNARTNTGSGPDAWRHDGTVYGVADLVGNIWEWVDGMKMVNGEFVVAAYTGQPEAEWENTGVYINAGQFSNIPQATLNASNAVWGSMTKASGYSGNERLQRLMIEPISCTSLLGGRFYWNSSGERFPIRGGDWYDSSNAGPAALNCNIARSHVYSGIGFRSAFAS